MSYNILVQFNNSDIYYGDECNLKGGESGVCLTIPECPGIVDELTGKSPAEVKRCGFMNDEALVCCSAADSAQNNPESAHLSEVIKEIEQCPDLYADLRSNRSPYNLWKGAVTFLVSRNRNRAMTLFSDLSLEDNLSHLTACSFTN